MSVVTNPLTFPVQNRKGKTPEITDFASQAPQNLLTGALGLEKDNHR
jgi:hypothetical protein